MTLDNGIINDTGLGGTFLLKEGKAKQHVMPDFSIEPLVNLRDLDNWLHFYEMAAPLIAVGTFVSDETVSLFIYLLTLINNKKNSINGFLFRI